MTISSRRFRLKPRYRFEVCQDPEKRMEEVYARGTWLLPQTSNLRPLALSSKIAKAVLLKAKALDLVNGKLNDHLLKAGGFKKRLKVGVSAEAEV